MPEAVLRSCSNSHHPLFAIKLLSSPVTTACAITRRLLRSAWNTESHLSANGIYTQHTFAYIICFDTSPHFPGDDRLRTVRRLLRSGHKNTPKSAGLATKSPPLSQILTPIPERKRRREAKLAQAILPLRSGLFVPLRHKQTVMKNAYRCIFTTSTSYLYIPRRISAGYRQR